MKWRGAARRTIPYLVSATSGFLLAYLIVALFVFPTTLISSDRSVPNVTGISYRDATAKLKQAGFRAVKGEQRYQTGVPEGAVLAQTPLPGSVEVEGTTIVLDVSRGQRMIDVPRVTGMTREQAQVVIETAGLSVGDVQEAASDAPRGQIVSTDPAGGAHAPLPSPVNLTVSAGPATVTIPDITGQDYASARSLLGQLGFLVGSVALDTTSTLPPNTVVSQTPAAHSTAPAGSTITLTISGRP